MPGVHELLRPTAPSAPEVTNPRRKASGREAHPQKITVYLSAEELLDLERARVTLRSRGVNVDRGRLVREAIALLLADLDRGVDASVATRHLRLPEPPEVIEIQPEIIETQPQVIDRAIETAIEIQPTGQA